MILDNEEVEVSSELINNVGSKLYRFVYFAYAH